MVQLQKINFTKFTNDNNDKKSARKSALILMFTLSFSVFPFSARAQSDYLLKLKNYREQAVNNKISASDQDKKLAEIEAEAEKIKDPEQKKLILINQAELAEIWLKDDVAEKIYQQLLQMPQNLKEYVHYQYAQLLIRKNKKNDAKIQLNQLLDLSPNVKLTVDSHLQLAKLEIEEKNYSTALKLLNSVEKRMRHEEMYPAIVYDLAQAERGTGRHDSFCKWVKKLYTIYPQYEKINQWGALLSADIFEGKPTGCSVSSEERRKRIKNLQWAGLGDKAFVEIKSLREQFSPKEIESDEKFEVDKLEVAYWIHEGDLNHALQILQPYYGKRKNEINYLNLLALTTARAGDFAASVGLYYRVYQLAPHGKFSKQALFQSAFLSYQFQDYDGATRKFQEFLKVFGTSKLTQDAKWHLAWIRYLRSDFEGAYESLENISSKRKPASIGRHGRRRKSAAPAALSMDRVRYWMAMCAFRMGQYEKAKSLFVPLAKDPMMGYYSVAAQFRLKKIEKLLPKNLRSHLVESAGRLTRFTSVSTMIPPDGYINASVEDDSSQNLGGESGEEALVREETINPLENTESTTESDSAAEGDDNAETTTAGEPNAEENLSAQFKDPKLIAKFEKARDLILLGKNDMAKWDLYEIEKRTRHQDYLKILMEEYQRIENYNRSSSIAQISFGVQRGLHGIEGVKYLWEYAYPKAYSDSVYRFSKQFDIPSQLVWGIMRAESSYKKDVMSPVGAVGLMQLMQATAQRVAGLMNEKLQDPRLLLEPDVNIKLGSRYLARLMRQFENSIPLVAASYNGGPHRVKSWLISFGQIDMDEFIEHIPFLETRNYVKRVISNYNLYYLLYGTQSNKKDLLADLSDTVQVKVTDKNITKETWEDEH